MAHGKFISYLRVSTKRQGESGLGLEAQRKAVADYLNGGRWELVQEFVEVESGRKTDRPQLERALAACRIHGAALVVAKLDRLARNAGFLHFLRDSGVDFIATDMPQANRLTVDIMAAVAEDVARTISNNTRVALAAAKARGVVLGRPENLTDTDRREGAKAGLAKRRAQAASRAHDLAPTVREIQQTEGDSLRKIAAGLNIRRIPTARGAEWTPTAVKRLLALL